MKKASISSAYRCPRCDGIGNPNHVVCLVGAFVGGSGVLPALRMDTLFATKPQEFIGSVGASLNFGVNELADVLHTFFLNVVEEED